MLSARFVKTVKPTADRQEYPDKDGLALRVTASGAKSWTLRYRVGGGRRGRRQRLTLGTYPNVSLEKARKAARKALGQVEAQGIDPAAVKHAARRGETFGELATEYLTKHAKKKKRSWRQDEWLIDGRLAKWKPLKVREITRRDVRELVETIAEDAPTLANRVLSLVRKMLNFAIGRDWLEVNPAWKLPKPGEERTRDRVLSDSEIREVWTAAKQERQALATCVQLLFLTAQRSGEVTSMRWADLDLDGGWWTIPGGRTKNKLSHRVPLVPAAVTLLRVLPMDVSEENTEGWVFIGRTGRRPLTDAKKAAPRIIARVLKARQAAGEATPTFHFTAHDMRRTTASRLAEGGVSRFVISRLLNHVEPGVTKVYRPLLVLSRENSRVGVVGDEARRDLERHAVEGVAVRERRIESNTAAR